MNEVAICNKALGMLGANLITTFNDKGDEARLCRDHYSSVRDSVMEQRPWAFALDRAELPMYIWPVDRPRPMGTLENCFALPPNCLRVLDVSSTITHDWMDGTIWEQEGHHIYAFADYLVCKFIYRNERTGHYSPLFIEALATRLASEWALPLTGSNSAGVKLYEQYMQKIASAAVVNAQKGNKHQPKGRLVRAREY